MWDSYFCVRGSSFYLQCPRAFKQKPGPWACFNHKLPTRTGHRYSKGRFLLCLPFCLFSQNPIQNRLYWYSSKIIRNILRNTLEERLSHLSSYDKYPYIGLSTYLYCHFTHGFSFCIPSCC